MLASVSKQKIIMAITMGLAVFILALIVHTNGWHTVLEFKTLDHRFKYTANSAKASKDIILLGIDEKSIETYGRWPWPRDRFANLIRYLNQAGAKVIAFDILFLESNNHSSSSDARFAQEVREADNVFLSLVLNKPIDSHLTEPLAHYFIPNNHSTNIAFSENIAANSKSSIKHFEGLKPPFPELANSAQGLGFSNILPDIDGTVRRLSLFAKAKGYIIPQLSTTIALYLLGVNSINVNNSMIQFGPTTIPITTQGDMLINWHGTLRDGSYLTYSMGAVLGSIEQINQGYSPMLPPDTFKDKIVFIAVTTPGIHNLKVTPLSTATIGTLINISALDTILHRQFIFPSHFWMMGVATLILCLGTSCSIVLSQSQLLKTGLSIALGAVYFAIAMYAFTSLGLWLELVIPESALLGTFIISSTATYLSEQRRSQAELHKRACQQAAVAELSQRALSGVDLKQLMDAASQTIAQTLSINYVNVLEFLPGQSSLRLCAGTGWKEGYVGRVKIQAVPNSITGDTLASNQPVVVENIYEPDFSARDPLLDDHNIVSSMTVTIPDQEGPPFGILGIYTCKRWRFSDNDRHFIQNVANVLAQAIARKRLEQRLLHDSLHDSLSGLPNRVLFMDRLEHAIQRTRRHNDYKFAVLFLDLDRFKVINDSLGHLIGDQLLIETGARLKDCVRPEDTIARIGGDEFTILLDDIENISETTRIAERIQQQISAPFKLGCHEIFISASIGIAPSTMGYESPNDLLRDADTVMYHAKMLGKGRHELFDEHMRASAQARWRLENDLRQAIERQEFQLYYQPIVALGSDKLEGFEALLRWRHPCLGFISPTKFIPIAEETGLILPIGQWVLREACQQVKAWQLKFNNSRPLTISVNLSGKQLSDPQLTARIRQILQETQFDAQLLKLEITETVFMENFETTAAILSQLRALNISLSIDDFGTGYSSLSYLHHFPANILKIDQSFVSRMMEGGESMAIIKTIITLAKSLGMSIIAEGIESAQQKLLLQSLRCESGQGNFFSAPLDSSAASALCINCAQQSMTRV